VKNRGACVPFTAGERTRLIIGGAVLVGGIETLGLIADKL